MKVDYIEETSVRKSLAFEIEPEVVEREIEARAREYARKVRLPGFRPGRVPPDVIKRRFRAQVLEDVAESLVNKAVFEELTGRGLKPLSSPKVVDLKIDENRPLTFRAVFETLPLIELPDYRGLVVKARQPKVTDEDVDREVDRLREQAARYDPVEDRPVQHGDFVVADLAARPASGAKAAREDNLMLEVGAERNFKDLNEGLLGMSAGETKEIPVREEAEESKANRTAIYTVTLKAIKKKILPAADDEFAKDLGEFDDLASLRESLRKRLHGADERRVDREVKNGLIEALVERASFEVPEALVERHMNSRTESAARGLAYQGIDPAKIGMDWKGYRDAQREDSMKAAKADILLNEIARREGIEVLPAELDAEVARLAERLKKSREALRLQMEKEGDLAALGARIREEKTLDLLKANARLELE